MADIPNLAGVATADLVEKIGGGNFQASYINWARTVNLLRVHAPGWMPELVPTNDGHVLHRAPQGGFLLIRFRHTDGTLTPEVPQAVMDSRNAAVAFDKVTARDITDTHRRGVCMAAAFTFGLAYELWARVALESGYADAADADSSVDEAVATTLAPGSDEDKRKARHDEAYGRHSESIAFIKERIAADDMRAVADEWRAIPREDQIDLWLAPTKGGCFTTAERAAIKERLPAANTSTQEEAA